MNHVQVLTKLFCLESSDNYLSDNETYNKCCNILCDANIDDSIKQERNIKPSLSEFKDKVHNKLSILLKDVDLIIDNMNYDEFTKYMNSISLLEENKKKISVLDLPTIFGSCDMTRYLISNDLELLPILIESIELNYHRFRNDLVSECRYVHEIGHSLSQRKKKTVKSFMHLEYAPVVLELFYTYLNYGEDSLPEYIIKRISAYQKQLSLPLGIINDQYGISQLLAFQTIEKYIDFNNWQKKEMLSRFRDCLNCDIQAEEFMKDYDIGFNDTESSVKSFRKTMERVGIK